MGYVLGIDLGTTYTAAAVLRDGRTTVVDLGTRLSAVPSVVFLRDDDEILTGEAANRRALTEPDRVAREFKRRVGDPTPILLGGAPVSVEALMSKLLRWVVARAEEREGAPPDAVGISHPANWGAFKVDVLQQAVRMSDLPDVTLLTEPEAAAIHYASQERIDPGTTIAVYDLGGGTFDAAVLRKTETGWQALGPPEGIDRLGGIDFDAAVFAHVQRSVPGKFEELDPDDPTAQAAVGRLRDDCVEAKEALSSDTDVSIPVLLPNVQTEVRLTRAEFEAMIRPSLADSIDAMRRALRAAGVEPAEVSIVLLVGGSSRVPLVAQLVSAEFGRPVALDVHPKHAVCQGAALAAAGEAGAAGEAAVQTATLPGGDAAASAAGAAVGVLAAGVVGEDTASLMPRPSLDAPPPLEAPHAPPPAPAPAVVASPPPPPPPAPPPSPPPAAAPAPPAPDTPPPARAEAPTESLQVPPPSAPPVPPPGAPIDGGIVAPGAGTPPPSGSSSRRGLLIGVAVFVVLVLVAGAVVLLLGGDDDGGDATSPGSTTNQGGGTGTTSPTTGSPGTTGVDLAVGCDRSRQVCITDVSWVEGPDPDTGETIEGLVAHYETDLNLTLPTEAESIHAHFYLSPTTVAATSGAGPDGTGLWNIWATPGIYSPFAKSDSDGLGITRADVGTNTDLCATVANQDHVVPDPTTEWCIPLPT